MPLMVFIIGFLIEYCINYTYSCIVGIFTRCNGLYNRFASEIKTSDSISHLN